MLAVLARLLWARDRERGLGGRLRRARRRFLRPTVWVGGAAAALIVTAGGFILYNTNILNTYRSTSDITGLRAVDIRGSYRLVNGGTVPIDSIHVATAMGGAETRAMTFDRTAALMSDDEEHAHRIYDLQRPLQPGDSLRLDFQVHVQRRGFRNSGADPWVVENGTYFTNEAWFPSIGYQWRRSLTSAADRRAQGLEQRPLLASLYEDDAFESTAVNEGIAFEAVIGTDEDQVAVAPGALRRTWTEGGRRYFHYSTDAPIGDEWSFFSANYAVHEGEWSDPSKGSERAVTIRLYHHPGHTAHLQRMMRSVRASLTYYSEQFSPYPYGHISLVEHPVGTGMGAHADASIISHSQAFVNWIPEDEKKTLDLPYYVIAHEMAHQWGLPYALVEGLPFLAEGLATYYGVQLVKETRGEEEFRRLLAFMRSPYPYQSIRRGEPLLRALDPYQSRRKGPFALVALGEYMGSDRVMGALRELYKSHGSAGARLVTTLDLYRELQAVTPDTLKPLLHDLFEVNTYWQFTTERVTAVQTGDSTWQVTLDVQARKVVFDSAGVATDMPINEWVPIGVFGAPARGAGRLSAPLYMQMQRIRSGEQTITVTVPRKPALAGIDPYHLLDWEEWEDDDNIERVESGT